MTGISRLLIAAPVLAAMAVAPAVAKADWHGRGGYGGGYYQQAPRGYYPHHREHGGDWAGAALAAGIIGLGVGAIVANSQPAYAYPPTYYAPPPVYYAPPPVYVAPGYYPAYPRY